MECFCFSVLPTCAPGEFQCLNGKCILPGRVCDGVFDCGFGDYTDEADCGTVLIIRGFNSKGFKYQNMNDFFNITSPSPDTYIQDID